MTEFNLSYQHKTEGTKTLKIAHGEILFLVGPNGTGKSTLMHNFATQNLGCVRRITAHRQIWFNTDSVDLTPASRVQVEQNIVNVDRQENSRYKDEYAHQRSQATIFDLIDSENVEARKIADAARLGKMKDVEILAKEQSPIAKMNDIIRMSNLHFQVEVDKGSKLTAIRTGFNAYSIAELSDGERNSLIIIANVLTAPINTLILLDEPERHLHRSIVSPLISTLMSYRDDCSFVVSTHDVSLPHDQNRCGALILREYSHQPRVWVADHVENVRSMDESTAISVLGSRKKLLFVEGQNTSLDTLLYQILYPDVSVKSVGSCVEVERVVRGIKSAEENHWISAFGIIDRDNRTDAECESLYEFGIVPLNQYSVESLYYHPSVIEAVLNRVASVNEIDVKSVMNDLSAAIVESVKLHKERLSARLIERKVKEYAMRQCPSWKSILEQNVNISFSTAQFLKQELEIIDDLINTKNIEMLICRYPLRETQALELIAKKSLFPTREKYEQAVRKMLIDSKETLDMVKNLIKPVTNMLLPNT
jgi:ABC-type lipoprotein export system ATPase subunit